MRELGVAQTIPAIMVSTAYTEPDAGVPIGLLGDSITAANDAERRNRGYWTVADTLLGQLYDVVAYAGIGGNTCAQMLARVATDVLAYNPDVCVVMGGCNDIAGGRTYAQIIADLEDIYDLLRADGIHIIATTSVPSISYATATQKTYFQDLATWVAAYVAAHPSDMTYIDTGSLYADANEHPQTGYTWDGVHPTALGGYTLGAAIATAIAGLAPARNLWLDAGDSRLINSNTAMGGAGGTTSGSATGTVATGFLGAGNAVFSKVARVPSGEWQQMVLNAGGDARLSPPSIDATARFVEGDTVVMEVEFESDNDWVDTERFEAFLQFRDSGGGELEFRSALYVDSYSGPTLTPAVYLPRMASGILRTEPTVVPVGCTAIRNYFYFKGAAGTVRVGRYQLRVV